MTEDHANKQSKSKASGDAIPVWFTLPRRFWEKLTAAQQRHSISQATLIMRGVDLAIKELDQKSSATPEDPPNKNLISEVQKRLSKMRWNDVSEEERRQFGRKLTAARLAKRAKEQAKTSD